MFVNELFPPTFQFPPPPTTVVGAAEASGDITTRDLSTVFFPPAYLFIPFKHARPCCIGGFHSFDVEPGDQSNGNLLRAFVLNYSTWDQPIFRDPTVLDVTGLSHDEDRKENEYSLEHGFRLLSAYKTNAGDRLWIITQADRSVMCFEGVSIPKNDVAFGH